MFRYTVRWRAVVALVGVITCGVCRGGGDVSDGTSFEQKWSTSIYYAKLNDGTLQETLKFRTALEDSSLVALALARTTGNLRDWFKLEVEGQVVRHFQAQDHWEFNLLGAFRWAKFPWEAFVETSVAAGVGLSYALEEPSIELKNHGKTAKFLGYLMFEVAVACPAVPGWELFARIHHRSGAGGVFYRVKDASNAYGVGVRQKR